MDASTSSPRWSSPSAYDCSCAGRPRVAGPIALLRSSHVRARDEPGGQLRRDLRHDGSDVDAAGCAGRQQPGHGIGPSCIAVLVVERQQPTPVDVEVGAVAERTAHRGEIAAHLARQTHIVRTRPRHRCDDVGHPADEPLVFDPVRAGTDLRTPTREEACVRLLHPPSPITAAGLALEADLPHRLQHPIPPAQVVQVQQPDVGHPPDQIDDLVVAVDRRCDRLRGVDVERRPEHGERDEHLLFDRADEPEAPLDRRSQSRVTRERSTASVTPPRDLVDALGDGLQRRVLRRAAASSSASGIPSSSRQIDVMWSTARWSIASPGRASRARSRKRRGAS